MVGAVLLVVALLVGCVGVAVVRPRWERYQLRQAYEQLDFQPFGFIPPGRTPVFVDSPLRVQEQWTADLERVDQPDFVPRAVDRLYTWSRNHGSTAPREDFERCFARDCTISWIYRDSHTVTIIVTAGPPAPIPRWDLIFILQPL